MAGSPGPDSSVSDPGSGRGGLREAGEAGGESAGLGGVDSRCRWAAGKVVWHHSLFQSFLALSLISVGLREAVGAGQAGAEEMGCQNPCYPGPTGVV